MNKKIRSQFDFGRGIEVLSKAHGSKVKPKKSTGQLVLEFVLSLHETIKQPSRFVVPNGEDRSIVTGRPANLISGFITAVRVQEQQKRARGGREFGTPNETTRKEILDPYDTYRAAGLDDSYAQSKVVTLLVPKERKKLGLLKKARRRVAKVVERHRGQERVHLEQPGTSGKLRPGTSGISP
jgi:hypothetical protein